MKARCALAILALIFMSNSLAAERIAWRKDYETALAQAKLQAKLLVAHFWLAGRPLHKAMDEEAFSNPEVVKFSNEKFVNVKINIGARPELFENTIGGRGGLGTCVLDGSGDVVSSLPGYADSSAYLAFLVRADRGHARLKMARAAAARSPRNPAVLHALAESYEALGSPRRAEEFYGKLIGLGERGKGSSEQVAKYVATGHERIARFRALRGRNLEATRHVEEYRRVDRDNRFQRLDRILLTEALVAWIERRFTDSIRILEGALSRYPASQERDQMLLALATVRHEGGEDQRALEILARLIKEYPQSSTIAQAKEQIVHIKNPPADHQH
jgi:tetratricopeptide (TPR) repeat protein